MPKEKNMHKATQKRFFELITSQVPLFAQDANPINTYKELIHYRFKEVVLSSFPRFLELLEEDLINDLVLEFIQSEPQTPFIWQMPNEFRAFLAGHEIAKKYSFMNDMLWFEWIEIELFMKNYKLSDTESFSWDKSYTLSDSALIKVLDYPVHYNEDYDVAGAYPLLMFYNFDTYEVHFQEITPFLQEFIALLEDKTANEALAHISSLYEVDAHEVKELLQETLEGFATSHLLKGKQNG